MEFKTPVAFLVYNRPEFVARTFNEIRKIKPPVLLVVTDGPNPNRPGDVEKCNAVREIIQKGIDWNCRAIMNYATVNLGCKRRVSSGLDWVFQEVEEAIILEDDCLPDPSFFLYCQELLEYYKDNPKIMHISGDNFQFGRKRGEASYYFSKYNHIWGWATWRRAWKFYDVNMKYYPEFKSQQKIQQITQNTVEQQYWMNIFETAYQGKVDTWDYQWVFTIWANDGLAVLPNINLVSNIGFCSDALHTKVKTIEANLKAERMNNIIHPTEIVRNEEADQFSFNHIFLRKPFPDNNEEKIPDSVKPNEYIKDRKNLLKTSDKIISQTSSDRQTTTSGNPSKQDLEVYWNPKMSEILETWGEGQRVA